MDKRVVEKLLDENIQLLEEWKWYIRDLPEFFPKHPNNDRYQFDTRVAHWKTVITGKLMSASAWLLGYLAVATGEIDIDQLEAANWSMEDFRHWDYMLPNHALMPQGMQAWWCKAHAYHCRIYRLYEGTPHVIPTERKLQVVA